MFTRGGDFPLPHSRGSSPPTSPPSSVAPQSEDDEFTSFLIRRAAKQLGVEYSKQQRGSSGAPPAPGGMPVFTQAMSQAQRQEANYGVVVGALSHLGEERQLVGSAIRAADVPRNSAPASPSASSLPFPGPETSALYAQHTSRELETMLSIRQRALGDDHDGVMVLLDAIGDAHAVKVSSSVPSQANLAAANAEQYYERACQALAVKLTSVESDFNLTSHRLANAGLQHTEALLRARSHPQAHANSHVSASNRLEGLKRQRIDYLARTSAILGKRAALALRLRKYSLSRHLFAQAAMIAEQEEQWEQQGGWDGTAAGQHVAAGADDDRHPAGEVLTTAERIRRQLSAAAANPSSSAYYHQQRTMIPALTPEEAAGVAQLLTDVSRSVEHHALADRQRAQIARLEVLGTAAPGDLSHAAENTAQAASTAWDARAKLADYLSRFIVTSHKTRKEAQVMTDPTLAEPPRPVGDAVSDAVLELAPSVAGRSFTPIPAPLLSAEELERLRAPALLHSVGELATLMANVKESSTRSEAAASAAPRRTNASSSSAPSMAMSPRAQESQRKIDHLRSAIAQVLTHQGGGRSAGNDTRPLSSQEMTEREVARLLVESGAVQLAP